MFLKTLQMINADNFIVIEPTVPFGGGVLLCFVFVLCVFHQMINVKKKSYYICHIKCTKT